MTLNLYIEDQVENLRSKVSKLENESQQFSMQRARMKELFLQKEGENSTKKQFKNTKFYCNWMFSFLLGSLLPTLVIVLWNHLTLCIFIIDLNSRWNIFFRSHITFAVFLGKEYLFHLLIV